MARSVRTDKVQIEIEINGKAVKNTIADLQKRYRQLNREIRNLTPGTEEFNNKARELAEVRRYLAEASQAARGFQQEQGLLAKTFGKLGELAKGAFAPLLALGGAGAFTAVTGAVAELAREFVGLRDAVNQVTGATGEALNRLTGDIKGVADTFGVDFQDVLTATNTVAKEFGVSTEEALAQISQGFINGADASGQYLDQLREYPAQLATVGLSLEEANALILQQTQEGIFSDKGVDAIKEAGLRLRELTPATREALEGIGLSAEEIETALRDGTVSLFDVITQVSDRLNVLPEQSTEVGAAIADIFGGPGEDAGLQYLQTLGRVQGGIEGVSNASREVTERQQAQLDATQELAQAKAALAEQLDGATASATALFRKGLAVAITGLVKFIEAIKTVPEFVRENKTELSALVAGLIALNAQSIAASVNVLRQAAAQKAAVVSTKALRIAQAALNVVMSANPIGLVVAAVAGLIIGFTQLYKRSQTLRAGLSGFFNSLKQVGKNILDNLIAQFTGLGQILKGVFTFDQEAIAEGIKTIRQAKGLGEGVAEAYREGFDDKIAEEQSAVADAIRRDIQNAINDGTIQDEAQELGKKLAEQLRKGLINEQQYAELSTEITRALNDAAAKVPDPVINPIIPVDDDPDPDAEGNAAAQAILKMQERLEDLRVQAIQDGLARRIAEIELAADREIAALEGTESQIAEATTLINERRQREILAAMEADAEAEAAKRDEIEERKRSQQERDLQRELAALDAYHQRRQTEITQAVLQEAQLGNFASQEEAEAEIQARMLAQLREYLEKRIALLQAAGQATADLELQLAQMDLEANFSGPEGLEGQPGLPEYFDEVIAAAEAASQAIGMFYDLQAQRDQEAFDTQMTRLDQQEAAELNAAANNAEKRQAIQQKFEQKREALEIQYRKREKNRAIVQSIIDTAIATARALATPPAPNVFAATLAGTLGAIQTGIIASQSFADGGPTGPGHGRPDHTGHRPVGVVHENEYVVPAWQYSSPVYRPLIDALEMGRMRGFADGGLATPVTPSTDSIAASSGAGQVMSALREEIKGLRSALGQIQFVLPVDERTADLVSRRQADLSTRRDRNRMA